VKILEIDVHSTAYKEMLAIDSREHSLRTSEFNPDDVPWTYDPFLCNRPSRWAHELIFGSEFERYYAVICKKLGRNARLIDLGCGPGGSSLWFAIKGLKVLGIDSCCERIKVAEEIKRLHIKEIDQAGGSLDYKCANFFEIDIDFFDVLLSVKTFHHVPSSDELLKKYLKVINPKGVVCVLDQMGKANFSVIASSIISAILPPGLCKTSWILRQKKALWILITRTGIKKYKGESDNPLEGIGQMKIIPAFRTYFKKLHVSNVDPLRLFFVAGDLKNKYNNEGMLKPFIILNKILKITGTGLEKSIIAHVEDCHTN
jgi:2-polyprenyl-3-methyl-5-hydroxy-6-metoxy-1,4-benzoquinol methylase